MVTALHINGKVNDPLFGYLREHKKDFIFYYIIYN